VVGVNQHNNNSNKVLFLDYNSPKLQPPASSITKELCQPRLSLLASSEHRARNRVLSASKVSPLEDWAPHQLQPNNLDQASSVSKLPPNNLLEPVFLVNNNSLNNKQTNMELLLVYLEIINPSKNSLHPKEFSAVNLSNSLAKLVYLEDSSPNNNHSNRAVCLVEVNKLPVDKVYSGQRQ
jgi:hypothetical protein